MIPAVEFRGLSKSFGGVFANRGVDLRVLPGTVHAIIGENGAGKSTAMKMLYGMLQPESGEILIDGEKKRWRSPKDAIACGIGMVHQHFMLAEPYTVIENIVIGAETAEARWKWLPRPFRPIDLGFARRKLEAISRQYGLKVDLDAPVEELSVGIHQRIEIIKLLYRDARILILDEPTAVLTPQETAELFVQLRKMRDEGKTILIITHKLKEVLSLADEVTVFRAGQVVGRRKVSETDAEDLASLMVGRKVNLEAQAPPARNVGAAALEVRDLTLPPEGREGEAAKHRLQRVSFEVRSGEVVGIAGVEGNGQSDLLRILLHPRDYAKRASGTIRCLGSEAMGPGRALSTREIQELGVGVIPEDRLREGLLLERPVSESFLLGLQRRAPYSRRGWISEATLKVRTLRAIEEYDVRPRSLEIAAGRLSGGNQQKLIIAREFEREPRFLIAAQPTRGVDVGAIEFIHQRILRARDQGAAVLMVSSELDEILALSDRILVMYEGEIVASFARGQADERALGIFMGGGRPARVEQTV